MKAYRVNGGRPLEGTVAIHGAKNSVLPILAACICCAGICEIDNCPRIADVDTAIAILEHLGCRVVRQDHRLTVDAATVDRCDIPGDLMGGMRSSILFLGALLTPLRPGGAFFARRLRSGTAAHRPASVGRGGVGSLLGRMQPQSALYLPQYGGLLPAPAMPQRGGHGKRHVDGPGLPGRNDH